ncbi:MAG: glycosyltransferase family 4 protein [Terracidiphilus sp.]
MATKEAARGTEVALLTGGADQPYAFGLAKALMPRIAALDLIGNDELDSPEFRNARGIRFFNLRGDQRPDASFLAKALRVLRYYVRLIGYSATARPRLFHILWNNKFEYFDRTALTLWYRVLGKKIVLTLHNVNARKRDGGDSRLNRFTLRVQYRLADHMFVHTERMKQELIAEFAVPAEKITVIPFGINNAVPNTEINGKTARERLGLRGEERAILFFGNIAPYKGLEYLVAAFRQIARAGNGYKLIIAGRPKNCETYWNALRGEIDEGVRRGSILLRDNFIPDEDTELYMKAADVLVLPYRYIYQSGVLFLGYSFGLPVLAADVGSLREEVVEGKTGFMFRSEDAEDLARMIERYFQSSLYAEIDTRRREIIDYAGARHSWDRVGQMTVDVYSNLAHRAPRKSITKNTSGAALDSKTN